MRLVAVTAAAETVVDTDKDVNVPTDVILGCAAVLRVPFNPPLAAMLPDTLRLVSVPMDVMLGCEAVVSVPERLVALRLPPVILPDTASEPSVPTEVIEGCAAVNN